MHPQKCILVLALAFGLNSAEPNLSHEQVASRVQDLVDELTIDEKYSLMNGVGFDGWTQFDGYYIGNTPAIERLKIPSLKLQDAGNGFRTSDSRMVGQVTSWTCALGLATTWDPELVREWASAVADEYTAKGANVILGPGLNVHRVARGGRNAEYMSGEDPFLGASFAEPFVSGFQDKGILTTMKHFGLNQQENNRNTYSANIPDARALWEVYYPPYQACIDAGVASAMCSYNLVNNTHSCSNDQLLNKDLKDVMGFEGWVMSDWAATHDTTVAEGLDQDMPGSNVDDGSGSESFFAPDRLAAVDEALIDAAVTRVLWPIVQYGLMDTYDDSCKVTASSTDCADEMYEVVATTDEHQALALKIATESVLLLKNEGDLLPITVPDAHMPAVSRNRALSADDTCSQESDWDYYGNDISDELTWDSSKCCDGCIAISGGGQGQQTCTAYTYSPDDGKCYYKSSSSGRTYSQGRTSGTVDSRTTDDADDFTNDDIDAAYTIAVVGSACNAANNVNELVNTWNLGNYYVVGGSGRVIPESVTTVVAGLKARAQAAGAKVVASLTDDVDAALAAAEGADIAFMCGGGKTTESVDRDSLSLEQESFMSAFAKATDTPTVAVTLSPGTVLMPFADDVEAVLNLFLAGASTGDALAAVAFGEHNPAAKSPVTFPKSEDDVVAPCSDIACEYSEGLAVGYRAMEDMEVNFPFGHGLSYTSFNYSWVAEPSVAADGSMTLTTAIENTGDRDGAEVVQLYLGFPAVAGEPPKVLKGYEKVGPIEAGASEEVSFTVDAKALKIWDNVAWDWAAVAGTFDVMVGSSSRDIRLEGSFDL